MEFDADVPIRSGWVAQLITEAYDPTMAVRGSRYRGDSWDAFLQDIPPSLLFHINGNAIYNITHPWLRYLYGELEREAVAGTLSAAFDVRMAELSLAEFGFSGDQPYKGDSLLIGNYAQMLMNESFEAPEFVRHGSLNNIFHDINETQITLAVLANRPDMRAPSCRLSAALIHFGR
ncbi:unnamed protein product [Effrenium voratum]|nr:unnamed protein product [Effrenium voratum]